MTVSVGPIQGDGLNKPKLINLSGIKLGLGSEEVKGDSKKKETLKDLTTEEIVHTEVKRTRKPIDLTSDYLLNVLGVESEISKLQRAVVRLRVVVNGETLGSGSGTIISSDGLILSNNHVPAIGKAAGNNPFEMLPGTNVLKNLKTWSELLRQDGKGEAKLVADIVLLPKAEPPKTIFTPGKNVSAEEAISKYFSKPFSKGSDDFSATEFSPYDNKIEVETYDVKIIDEYPQGDLILARLVKRENGEKSSYEAGFPFIKITDSIPITGQDVYSIGHPGGIKHNALSLGTVLDSHFDIQRVQQLAKAHAIVLGGVTSLIGEGINPDNFLAKMAKTAAIMNASVDFEPARPLVEGGLISDVNIAPGSSGGLLANEKGEQVGVTYMDAAALVSMLNPPFGMLYPLSPRIASAYISGALGYSKDEGKISRLSGSIGMKNAIPFLERNRVNITKIRDGEPAGVQDVESSAARLRARVAMSEAYKAQTPTISQEEIEDRLAQAGFPKEKVSEIKVKSDNASTTDKSRYEIVSPESYDDSITFQSKPIEVLKFDVELDVSDPAKLARLVLNAEIKTEDGKTVEIKDFQIDPVKFNIDYHVDSDTRQILVKYFTENFDKAQKLYDLQQKALEHNKKITEIF